jgi:CBS domain-containing protein
MYTVKHLLDEKGRYVWAVEAGQTVLEALELMAEKDIGAVLVMDDAKIVGIFSERDFARYAVGKEEISLRIPVSELMTTEVFYVGENTSIDQCMALMNQKRIRHVPVLVNQQPVGIVSMRDVVDEYITEKDITIHGLENFIIGFDADQ